LCTDVQVFLSTPRIFPEWQILILILYRKLPFFRFFWAVSPHVLSQNGKIWREGAKLGYPPPCQMLQKLVNGVYPIFGQILPKIGNFGYFDACKPTFLKPQPWSLARDYEPGTPSPCLMRGDWRDTRLWTYVAWLVVEICVSVSNDVCEGIWFHPSRGNCLWLIACRWQKKLIRRLK